MTATLVLSFGIIAIANLSVVAVTDNGLASRTTAAAFLASQKLEELRATPYETLTDSNADSLDNAQTGFNQTIVVPGAGSFDVRWRVFTVGAGIPPMRFIAVRAESTGFRGRQSRSEFSTFRTCSAGPTAGCP